MGRFVRLVPPNGALEVVGVKLVGVTADNGKKLLFSLVFLALIILIGRGLRWLAWHLLRGRRGARESFWAGQAIRLVATIVILIGVVSIWFDDPTRLTTALGLVTAGLTFALQRVVTAVAGYFVILRGQTFDVGDRITMGGVRADVIALGFVQTTIMEMGQPPAVQAADPAMWVKSRQYTGRIVTVTNDKIFDEPVFNYTRDFPFIWEEMSLWVGYDADVDRAERILLDAASAHSIDLEKVGEEALGEMERRYVVRRAELRPKAYLRITDNYVELTVRYITMAHGIREVKDAMSRQVLRGLREAGIEIASTSVAVADLPPLRIERAPVGAPDGRS